MLRFCPAVFVPLAAVCICLSGSVAHGQSQDQPPLNSADAAAQKIFQRTASTGLVVGIVRNGEVWTGSYGRLAPGSNQLPAANSLLRLCSITKILATDVLAKFAVEKKVSFDDPLQKFARVQRTSPFPITPSAGNGCPAFGCAPHLVTQRTTPTSALTCWPTRSAAPPTNPMQRCSSR